MYHEYIYQKKIKNHHIFEENLYYKTKVARKTYNKKVIPQL